LDEWGVTTITLTVSDGAGGTATDRFVVTVTAVNDPPTITAIGDVTTDEDVTTPPLWFTVSDAETRPEGLRVTVASANATLVPTANIGLSGTGAERSLRLTPAVNQSGVAAITVAVTDAGLDGVAGNADDLTVPMTFTLTVTSLNDPPVVSFLGDVAIDEDTSTGAVGFTVSDVETEARDLVVTAASTNPELVATENIVLGGSGGQRTVQVTPRASRSGAAQITVTVMDGGLDGDPGTLADNASTTQTFAVLVNAVVDAPTLDPIPMQRINQDAGTQVVLLTGITAGGDTGVELGVTALSNKPDSILLWPTLEYVTPADTGRLFFTPVARQSGVTQITVTVTQGGTDGRLATPEDNKSFSRSFTVTVNGAPIAITLEGSTILENQPGAVVGVVGVRDPDAGDRHTLVVSDNRFEIVDGKLQLRSDRQLDREAEASVGIWITAVDSGLLSISQEFTLAVVDVNEFAPVLDDTTFSVAENSAVGTVVGTVTATDGDATNGGFTYRIVSGNGLGVFAVDNAGRITVVDTAQLDREQVVQVALTIEVSDNGPGTARTDAATVTVNVLDVTEFAPVLDDATFSVAENSVVGTVVGTVTATDGDATNGGFTYRIVSGNGLGIFAVDNAGRITVADAAQLDREQVAQVVLTIEVSDNGPGTARTDTAAVTVAVSDVNERPQIVQPIPDQPAVENIALRFTVPAGTFVDPDAGDQLTYTAQLSAGGELPGWLQFDAATCTFSGTPPFGAAGPLALQVTARDRDGLEATAAFTLTVSVNPRPWQNPVNALDVDSDGQVKPLDVLLIINYINARGSGRPPVLPSPQGPVHYFDVSGDSLVAPLDVLLVINYINAHGAGGGEGEAADGLAASWDGLGALGRGLPTVPEGPSAGLPVCSRPSVSGFGLCACVHAQAGEVGRPAPSAQPRAELPTWDDALDVLAEDVARAYAALESN
jgi:hypothetical protein